MIGFSFSSLTTWGYCYIPSIAVYYFLFFSMGNMKFHEHEILCMLDTSSLFFLLTLKGVYPVLKTAFL